MSVATRLAVAAVLFTFGASARPQPVPATAPPSANAAAPAAGGIKRTLMQRSDVPTNVPHECVFGSAELPAGTSIGRHTHFGVEIGTVVEGEADLSVDGEPVRHVRAGDSWNIPAGRPHDARATGSAPAKVIATWVVEKGKPLSTPAPAAPDR